jgi:hypothetical protein
MNQQFNLVQGVFQQYFRKDIIFQYLKQAQTPFQSSELFPIKKILANNPNQAEPRKEYNYRIVKGKPLAGEINEGSTEYPTIGAGSYEDRKVGIIELGDSIKYTKADEERIRQMNAISAALTVETSTLSILNEYLPTNPTQLMTAMDNSKEIINFYGNAGLAQLRKTGRLKVEPTGTVFGLLNNPDIDTVTISGGIWANKDGAEIFRDVLQAYNYIYTTKSGFTIRPTTLLVDPVTEQVLSNTLFNDYQKITVADQIRSSLKLEIVACPWIVAQGTDEQRFFIYAKNPQYIELIDSANPYIMNMPEYSKALVEYSMRSYTAGLAIYDTNSISSFKGFI